MAERINDEQVDDLLRVIRSDASVDAKVQLVNAVKSGIKQHNVPDHLIPQVFDGLRTASSSQHAVLVNAGFTSLNHLLTRLSRQEPKYLAREVKATLPLVIEKLGDQKEKFRSLASQALVTLYGVAPAEVDRMVRNIAMAGKNPRAKEAGMHWVLEMHRDHAMPFRAYVPTLMDLLEDADGMVRDNAKITVIELFKNAPNTAKSDLKRQLKNFKVRPAIEQAIVKALAPAGGSRPETPHEPVAAAPAPAQTRLKLAASMSSLSGAERPTTPALEPRTEQVEPAYVNTQRELDEACRDMHMHFEGRESEQNWLKREESIIKLRRFISGNAPQDFCEPFMANLKSLLDGIIKGINSLRTSLSKESSSLVQDIAVSFGSVMDPLVELLMQTFIKLCAATKKIASQMANVTIDTMLSRVSYSNRLMQHLWGACQDKNVQPRTYAAGWLQTVLKREGLHKSQIEHGGGVDLFEKCIKKGLADANPGVRERMRATYWAFASIWPDRADVIMTNLEPTAQKLLNKDPHNPNGATTRTQEAPARPGLGLSKSTMSQPKPSLRETMLAQKKAMSTRNVPTRPGSAMAHISPSRNASGSSTASGAPAANAPSTSRARPESTTVSGGMSTRPMRPVKRRPEVAPRPATAGPYSSRGGDRPGAEAPSPDTLRSKAAATSSKASPRRAPLKSRPGHMSHASESSVATSPSAKVTAARAIASPKASPARLKQSHTSHLGSSPGRPAEDLDLLAPPAAGAASPTPKVVVEREIPMELSRESPAPELQPLEVEPEEIELAEAPAVLEPAVEPEVPLAEEEPPAPAVEVVAQPETEVEPEKVAPEAEAEQVPVPDVQQAVEPATEVEAPTPSVDHVAEVQPQGEGGSTPTPNKTIKVFEDPFTSEEKPQSKPVVVTPVLEDRSVNESAPALQTGAQDANNLTESPDKMRQSSRLLESGITRVKAQSLDVHGFRKLQGLIRDNRAMFTDEKFEALLVGLFEYLECQLPNVAPEKMQDVKAQILATVKLLLKKEGDRFQPHVSRGLESLVVTRSWYDGRTHIVSGLELLAAELVLLSDPPEVVMTMTKLLQDTQDDTTEGARKLSMGLHILKEVLDKRESFVPSEGEIDRLGQLSGRCLESADSSVRMGGVQLCVALHSRIGDKLFWEAVQGAKDDPKNLITYYIAKRQREAAGVAV